jgi:hypothetical protein
VYVYHAKGLNFIPNAMEMIDGFSTGECHNKDLRFRRKQCIKYLRGG